MNTMADKRLSQLDCLDVQDDDEITENGIDKPEDNVDDGNKAYDRSTLHAAFRQLREAQQSLEEALFETRNKLNKSSEAHSLDLNELVRYAHYISIDHSVAAPLNWEQGDPRRLEKQYLKIIQKILYKTELVNPVSAFRNSPQYFCDVNADKTKPTSENSEPIKSEALKLSDCVSVMASS